MVKFHKNSECARGNDKDALQNAVMHHTPQYPKSWLLYIPAMHHLVFNYQFDLFLLSRNFKLFAFKPKHKDSLVQAAFGNFCVLFINNYCTYCCLCVDCFCFVCDIWNAIN